MLAGKCTDITKLKYPVLATPKLDGIRCLIIKGDDGKPRAVSRNFKPIPNNHVRKWLEEHCAIGFDGELVVPNGTFQETSSAIMSRSGAPWFEYKVFDYYTGDGYEWRMDSLKQVWDSLCFDYIRYPGANALCSLILPYTIVGPDALEYYEEACIEKGFEGVMVRSPDGPYKFGRSTEREGYLLKIKRFEDSEAVIIGFEEKMHNANEATKDELGRTKRSSHKDNQVPTGTLGALLVEDMHTKVRFRIGTGFDDEKRGWFWQHRHVLSGLVIKYKSQPSGVLDKPRFPVYLGLRSSIPNLIPT